MKVRHGFVSNSSTTSFVVEFPHIPNSDDDLYEMMGLKDFIYGEMYQDERWQDVALSPATVAEEIFLSIGEPLSINLVLEENMCRCKYDEFCMMGAEDREIIDFIKKCDKKGTVVYRFEFGNEGAHQHLENADVFRNLNHVTYNNH